jgi:hypothetical protein
LAENTWSTEFKALTPKQPTPDASALRAAVADFLADQLPKSTSSLINSTGFPFATSSKGPPPPTNERQIHRT